MSINRNLYWAFGLVAGSWAICLLISGVIFLVGNGSPIAWLRRQSRMTENSTDVLKQFISETEFRQYFAGSQKMFTVPAELPPTATFGATIAEQFGGHALSPNQEVVETNQIEDKVIIITKSPVYGSAPCPLSLFDDFTIPCEEVWHPTFPTNPDSTFTISQVDSLQGSVDKQFSFVGISGQTGVHLTQEHAYITFSQQVDEQEVLIAVLLDPTNTLIDEPTKTKIQKTQKLPISSVAKMAEIDQILLSYTTSMSDAVRMKWNTEKKELIDKYLTNHRQELENTTVVKVRLSDFSVVATGGIPGYPLSQDSLHEYQGLLLVVTKSDAYILDQAMKVTGSITNLVSQDRLYSAQFFKEKGYLTTYRESDPITVVDFTRMSVVGTLPIAGFSSDLYQLSDNLLLGITQEQGQTELSLFDTNTLQVLSTRTLTGLQKGFLLDQKNEKFLISSKYIVSFSGSTLELKPYDRWNQ